MTVQIIEIAGQRMAVLPEAEFIQLSDMAEENADIRAAMLAEARAEAGEEYVPHDLVQRILDGDAPLRVWREYRGLSQQALADRVGLSKMTISSLETGRQSTSIRNWRLLADALSIDLIDILPPD